MLTLLTSGRRRGAAALSVFLASTIVLAACADSPSTAPGISAANVTFDRSNAQGEDQNDDDQGDDAGPGAVYTLTNATSGNAVVAFRRATDGSLTRIGTF